MGKSQQGVFAALKQVRQRLPFELRGLHSDGSEFLNGMPLGYCRGEGISFSRSRPFRKNDNAHLEQKNWTLVRKLIGYQRLETAAQLAWLNALYSELLRPYNNCFQPVMKLIAKERQAQQIDGNPLETVRCASATTSPPPPCSAY